MRGLCSHATDTVSGISAELRKYSPKTSKKFSRIPPKKRTPARTVPCARSLVCKMDGQARDHCVQDLHYTRSTSDCTQLLKSIILTRRLYNDFQKLTSLRVPKVTIFNHSQRSSGQYMYPFLYNDFYFNDRFLLVNSLELVLRYI